MTIDGTKQVVFQGQTKLTSLNGRRQTGLELETPVGTGRVNNAALRLWKGTGSIITGLNNGVNAAEIKKAGNSYSVSKLMDQSGIHNSLQHPVLKDGFLYGISAQSRLFCINASTGQTAWTMKRRFRISDR